VEKLHCPSTIVQIFTSTPVVRIPHHLNRSRACGFLTASALAWSVISSSSIAATHILVPDSVLAQTNFDRRLAQISCHCQLSILLGPNTAIDNHEATILRLYWRRVPRESGCSWNVTRPTVHVRCRSVHACKAARRHKSGCRTSHQRGGKVELKKPERRLISDHGLYTIRQLSGQYSPV
jgi:hypothetical protein